MLLRRIKHSDLDLLFSWRNDPRVYEWCRQFAPLHWENHISWYQKQAADPTLDMFIVEHPGGPVGVCGLTDIDMVNRRAEFSLYIAPKYTGREYGRETLIDLLRHGFNNLGLNRIYGETFAHNKAQRLFESLGMEYEGLRRDFYFRSGRFVDAKLYSISAAGFNASLNGEAGGGEEEVAPSNVAIFKPAQG